MKNCFQINAAFVFHWLLCGFYVCGETNTARYLVTNQIAFCAARPTKKLSLKRSFCAAVFICFFN